MLYLLLDLTRAWLDKVGLYFAFRVLDQPPRAGRRRAAFFIVMVAGRP